jgi:hypothetical protein
MYRPATAAIPNRDVWTLGPIAVSTIRGMSDAARLESVIAASERAREVGREPAGPRSETIANTSTRNPGTTHGMTRSHSRHLAFTALTASQLPHRSTHLS